MVDPTPNISEIVSQLRAIVMQCDTTRFLQAAFTYHIRHGNEGNSDEPRLHSPARQTDFILSLLLSTPEPSVPTLPGDMAWKNVIQPLNKAVSAYMEPYFREILDKDKDLSEAQRTALGGALSQFMHHHNTSFMASPDQIKDRVSKYVQPFDSVIQKELKLSATRMLEIADWMSDAMQQRLDDLFTAFPSAGDRIKSLGESISFETIKTDPVLHAIREKINSGIRDMGLLPLADFLDSFPNDGATFLDLFSVKRGTAPLIEYPTQEAVCTVRPIIYLDRSLFGLSTINSLYTAILLRTEAYLRSSDQREKYFKFRARKLEEESLEAVTNLIGPGADIFPSCYETANSEHEHDIVAVHSGSAFIIECKASTPDEPFRDPQKAVIRLRRSFAAEEGIQKGFEQGVRIQRRLKQGEDVPLYNRKGGLLTTLVAANITDCYCIVVTYENFGPLASNLSIFLSKDETDPYPWVVNVFDLQNMERAWKFLGHGIEKFSEYLSGRSILHGKVTAGDELEYAGFFLTHGNFDILAKKGNSHAILVPDYSDFFDELYRHQYLDGPQPTLHTGAPTVSNLREYLRTHVSISEPETGPSTVKPSRNQKCPCGSGKRYRRCCGKRGKRVFTSSSRKRL